MKSPLIVGAGATESFRRFVEQDQAMRNGSAAPAAAAALEAAAAEAGPEQIQTELHPNMQAVEFKTRSARGVERSIFVPFQVIEILYYNILGARLAPLLVAMSGGGTPDSPSGTDHPRTGLTIHREPPP